MKTCVALVIGVVSCGDALAQVPTTNQNTTVNPRIRNTVNPQTNSNAVGGGATANPASTSGATANPASTSGATANPSASSGSSAVTISTGNTSFPSGQTILTVPQVYVPSVATGNVCALGASAGASWLGAGFAVGTSWESMQCERRQTAALLFNMGTPESKAAAKEVLCNSPEIRNAYLTIGHPCAADMMQVAGVAGRAVKPPPEPPPPPAFDPSRYAKASDCLTAAQAAQQPLSACAGKR